MSLRIKHILVKNIVHLVNGLGLEQVHVTDAAAEPPAAGPGAYVNVLEAACCEYPLAAVQAACALCTSSHTPAQSSTVDSA